MASLYEINQEMLSLINEDGEITDPEAFESLGMAFSEKVENIGLWIKNLKAEAEMYRTEKQAFAEKQARAEKKAESLKAYLARMLNGQKFHSTRVDVSYRRSETLKIDDIYALPDEYLQYSEPTANKVGIKTALKAGITVPGVEIVENNNLIIK